MAASESEFKVSKLCLQALQSRLEVEGKIEFYVYILKNVFKFLNIFYAIENLKGPLGQT